MVFFYREKGNADYLAIDTTTNRHYLDTFGADHFEGRATAMAGLVGSVCTTGISKDYLRCRCKRVARSSVPVKWQRAIGF